VYQTDNVFFGPDFWCVRHCRRPADRLAEVEPQFTKAKRKARGFLQGDGQSRDELSQGGGKPRYAFARSAKVALRSNKIGNWQSEIGNDHRS
jgi:hypothetical protein